jgi:hypothetical protein
MSPSIRRHWLTDTIALEQSESSPRNTTNFCPTPSHAAADTNSGEGTRGQLEEDQVSVWHEPLSDDDTDCTSFVSPRDVGDRPHQKPIPPHSSTLAWKSLWYY